MECLNCKLEVGQTEGKRPKLYCSQKCRIEYFRKKKAAEKPKGKRGRPPKAIDPVEIQAKIAAVKESLKGLPILHGPMKEKLTEISKENAKLAVQAAISLVRAEKIPAERDKSTIGRKSWALDQKKRIQELENKLK